MEGLCPCGHEPTGSIVPVSYTAIELISHIQETRYKYLVELSGLGFLRVSLNYIVNTTEFSPHYWASLWCTEKYDPFATQPYTIRHYEMYFNRKKINLLSQCVPHTVHSETVLIFPINNIIFRIIIYLFNQNK